MLEINSEFKMGNKLQKKLLAKYFNIAKKMILHFWIEILFLAEIAKNINIFLEHGATR